MHRYTATPYSIVFSAFDVLLSFLFLRFLFVFFGANPEQWFVEGIMNLTRPLVMPFENIFRTVEVDGFRLEWSTIIATIVFAVLASLTVHILDLLLADDDIAETHVRHHHHRRHHA
jgi:uncharacterized protein YggT (Ycf19 family)